MVLTPNAGVKEGLEGWRAGWGWRAEAGGLCRRRVEGLQGWRAGALDKKEEGWIGGLRG